MTDFATNPSLRKRANPNRARLLFAMFLLVAPLTCDSRTTEQRARDEFEAAARTPQGRIAGLFAQHLVDGAFDRAATMLTAELRETETPEALATHYRKMIEYGEGPALSVQPITFLDDWPDRRADDLGWAHVAIEGEDFNEAVSVVVTREGLIRSIEWGRP